MDPSFVVALVVAFGAAVPGIAALINARTSRQETSEKIDQEAFKAARDFYAGTLDEYREELTNARQALRDARAELEASHTDRNILKMQIAMIEQDKKRLEDRVQYLETKLKQLGSDLPTPDEG